MKLTIHTKPHLLALVLGTTAILLSASSASAQNIYVGNWYTGAIYSITPSGSVSTFTTAGPGPEGLAFNNAGDLFESASDNGSIVEVTPGGSQSTFASNLSPNGLAFNNAGNLFDADYGSGNIYEFTPGGTKTTFATVASPFGLAFSSVGDLYVSSYTTGGHHRNYAGRNEKYLCNRVEST